MAQQVNRLHADVHPAFLLGEAYVSIHCDVSVFPLHVLSLGKTQHGDNRCLNMSLNMEVNGLFIVTSGGDGPVDATLSGLQPSC